MSTYNAIWNTQSGSLYVYNDFELTFAASDVVSERGSYGQLIGLVSHVQHVTDMIGDAGFIRESDWTASEPFIGQIVLHAELEDAK